MASLNRQWSLRSSSTVVRPNRNHMCGLLLGVGSILNPAFTLPVGGSGDAQYSQDEIVHGREVVKGTHGWRGRTSQDLFREYPNIFRSQNRNAASHKWATFLFERSQSFDEATFKSMFASFCAVSGSPVQTSDFKRYGLVLDQAPGNTTCGSGKNQRFGYMYYCCWPCVCDTQDFIRVDSKTVRIKAGGEVVDKEFWFNVIANPCEHEAALAEEFVQPFDRRTTSILDSAPEVRCEPDPSGRSSGGRKLRGATLSDRGHPIVSMFFDSEEVAGGGHRYTCSQSNSDKPGRMTAANAELSSGTFQSECEYRAMCRDRARQGYNSGMGEIFRRVAGVAAFPEALAVGGAGAIQPGGLAAGVEGAAAAFRGSTVDGVAGGGGHHARGEL